jgi:hypothetical protein
MTPSSLPPPTRRSFDALLERLAASPITLTEETLLRPTHWALGEDARLREDLRFRLSPWGRWLRAEDLLANDALYRWLHAERRSVMALEAALARAGAHFGRRCVLCPDDPRFVLRHDAVHLAAGELSRLPVIEAQIGDLEKYTTHLPLHSLKAAAASLPAGAWGRRAQEEVIETPGWVRVTLSGRRLNPQMFVAAVEGHSMDDGKSGLVDGGYAVFELWPAGSSQHASVLVRGAFTDPETGSYAVKKLVADPHDAEGRLHRVSLVSLHPDKARYPDITLRPEDGEDVTVVARVVQALSLDDYERRPKPGRGVKLPSGTRDLSSRQGLAALRETLEARLEALLHPPPAEDPSVPPPDGALGADWQSRLELDDDGLRLRLGPLTGLPATVNVLDVFGARGDGALRARQVRLHPSVVPLRPQHDAYTVRAEGLDAAGNTALAALDQPGLQATRAEVFVPGARDVWRRVGPETVRPGRTVRVVVPPSLAGVDLTAFEPCPLGDGWQMAILELPAPLSAPLCETLAALGLSAASAGFTLTVSGAFPRRIDETPRGDALPIWRVGDPVTVTLRSTAPVAADSAKVFVLGPQGLSALALPEGQAWTLRLDDLAPGPYLLRVLAVSTGVEPEEMVFAVREGAHGRWPAARASVQLDARPLPTTPDEASPLADLRAWPQPWPLEVTAPPCWPLAGRWHTPSPLRLPRLYADEAGRFDLTTWPGALAPVLQTARGGLLTLDLGLLGRASVQHDAAVEAERVRTELCALWEPFVGLITPHAGHPGQWFEEWFRPMLSALGWIVAPTLDAVQPGVSTAKLRRARLSSSSFLLALVAPDRFDDPAVRQAVRDALRTATHDPFEEAMLSDGLRWCLYKPGRNRWHAPIAFPDAVADPVQFAHFFQDFDAG